MTSKEYAKKIKEQRKKTSLITKVAKFTVYSLVIIILFLLLRRLLKNKQNDFEQSDKQVEINKPEKNE